MCGIRPSLSVLVVALALVSGALPASVMAEPTKLGSSCVGLDAPSDGVVANHFEPGPNYSGHWGIDYVGDTDGYARAAAGGRVTFAGMVADNLVVTVDHGGGLRTSYSYLAEAMAEVGTTVARGTVIGRIGSGRHHDGLHFSTRIDGVYLDPLTILGCRLGPPSAGLRLVPAPADR